MKIISPPTGGPGQASGDTGTIDTLGSLFEETGRPRYSDALICGDMDRGAPSLRTPVERPSGRASLSDVPDYVRQPHVYNHERRDRNASSSNVNSSLFQTIGLELLGQQSNCAQYVISALRYSPIVPGISIRSRKGAGIGSRAFAVAMNITLG